MYQAAKRALFVALLAAVASVDVARAQCDTTQLCPAGDDPCVVAAPCTVHGTRVFDLGDRHLVIDDTVLTLATGPFGDSGSVIIHARAVTLTPGARIVAAADGTEDGPMLAVDVTGDFRMESDGTGSSRIDLGRRPYPQFIEVMAGGSIVVHGAIAFDTSRRSGIGGGIYLVALGDVVVEGEGLSARGGGDATLEGFGGEVELLAGGSLRLDAPVDVAGADCSPCSVDLRAEGDILVRGDIDMRATDRLVGDGGAMDVETAGDVRLEGTILGSARGSGGPDEGDAGEGGSLDVVASTVQIVGDVLLPGAAPTGDGGFIDVEADRIEVGGTIDVRGPGPFGFGGTVRLEAYYEGLAIDGIVNADGGYFGGDVEATSLGRLDVAGEIASAGEFASIGIELEGCDVRVRPGARLESGLKLGNRIPLALTARGDMTIAGELLGPTPAILRFRDRAPVIQPTAVFEQPPTLEQVPGLACCGACESCAGLPDGNPCDDGNACTSGDRCSAGLCTPVQTASCGACELCDGTGGCVAAPRPHCRLASGGSGMLRLGRGATPARDTLMWSWRGSGETTIDELGNPAADTRVALCLFDDTAPAPALLLRATAPAGGLCGKRSCWRLRSGSSRLAFSYRDPSRTPEGVVSARLETSIAGRDRMRLVAKGPLLRDRPFGLPPLPLPVPLRAQLQASDGGCWETRHE